MIEASGLLVLSLLLLFLEFCLPGGILAILAACSYFAALYLLIYSGYGIGQIVLFFVISQLLVIATVKIAIRYIRKSSKDNTFFLEVTQTGYQGAFVDKTLIGKVGSAVSDMGPSGFVLIDGKRLQAISSGPYITRGEAIVVIGAQGAYLVVQRQK